MKATAQFPNYVKPGTFALLRDGRKVRVGAPDAVNCGHCSHRGSSGWRWTEVGAGSDTSSGPTTSISTARLESATLSLTNTLPHSLETGKTHSLKGQQDRAIATTDNVMEHDLKKLAAAVWDKLDDSAKRRTSPENVLDALEARARAVSALALAIEPVTAIEPSRPETDHRSDVLTLTVQCPHCKLKMEIDRPRLFVHDATPCTCEESWDCLGTYCHGELYRVKLLDDTRCSSCNTPFNVVFPT